VSESTLRRMIANREITAIRIGGRPGGLIRIRPSVLQEATLGWRLTMEFEETQRVRHRQSMLHIASASA